MEKAKKTIKQILLPITILAILVIVWLSIYKFYEGKIEDIDIDNIGIDDILDKEGSWNNIQDKSSETTEAIENSWATTIITEGDSETLLEQKIENLRNRLKLKWLIVRWDLFFENNQLPLALKNYLQVHKESPNDNTITKRLGDTYFEMNNFEKAYEYYKNLKEGTIPKQHLILTLFYSKDLNKIVDRKTLQKELKQMNLNEEEQIYYINSIECLEDFHICKQNFQDYFKENEKLKDKNLISIKESIENYKNSKIWELYYKNALIIGEFYKNELYPVSIMLWQELLKEKKDYKPILQIIAKSQFNLWKYEESKITLSKYYSLDEDDAWMCFLLGVVNSKLQEYLLSNIYLNKAEENWYTPKIDVRRRLIYNYYLIWNTEKLLSDFRLLVKEEWVESEDIQLAIYYHIINDELEFALQQSREWVELFPEDDMFYWYLWWILKEKKRYTEADEILRKWQEINPRNPLILLNLWMLQQLQWDTGKSVAYFKKTIKINEDWEFWRMAKKQLELIMEEKQ